MVEKNKVWPTILVSALVVLSVFFNAVYIADVVTNKPVNVDLTNVASKADVTALNTKIDALKPVDITGVVVTEQDAEEAKALEVATAYLSDKHFLKLLNDAKVGTLGTGLTAYDDYELSTSVINSDVTNVGNTYTVTFDLKVLDGSDKLGRLNAVAIRVNKVDYDNAFKYIEVVEPTAVVGTYTSY